MSNVKMKKDKDKIDQVEIVYVDSDSTMLRKAEQERDTVKQGGG